MNIVCSGIVEYQDSKFGKLDQHELYIPSGHGHLSESQLAGAVCQPRRNPVLSPDPPTLIPVSTLNMTTTITQSEVVIRTQPLRRQHPEPLKPSGALDQFNHVEVTPVIGREYPHVNVVDDLLNAGNSDELLRDLAITSRSIV